MVLCSSRPSIPSALSKTQTAPLRLPDYQHGGLRPFPAIECVPLVPIAAWFKSRPVERSPRMQASVEYAVNPAAEARGAPATRQAGTRPRPTPIHGARYRVLREVVARSVVRPGGRQGHRLWPEESWTSTPVCGLVGPQAANWQPENAARGTISRFMRRTCPGRRLRGRTGPGRRAPMPPRGP